MTTSPPIIEVVGGNVPTDELLSLLADWLLGLVDDQDGGEGKPHAN